MNSRVFVIGLDGATFDLLQPWIDRGDLPNLGKMMKTSSYGLLESTIPPLTPPAWTSFMTGVNPGKHGIYDFLQLDRNSLRKVSLNSTHIRSRKIWNIAGERGKRSIVLYVPFTHPPEKIEGVLISGIPTSSNEERIYPKEMEKELEEKLGSWWVDMTREWFTDFSEKTLMEEIDHALEVRFKVANYFICKEWDLFVLVLSETDFAQHLLWHEKDRRLLPVFKKIDEMMGEILGKLKKQDKVLILSDHGFGPVRKVIYINSWLKAKGFLASRKEWVRRGEERNPDILRGPKNPGLLARVKRIFDRRREVIDWDATRAYFLNLGQLPGIWVNPREREKGRYDQVRDQLAAELGKMEDGGRRVVERVFRREEIYSGPYLEDAPDIVFLPDFEYTLSDRMGPYSFRQKEGPKGWHRLHGIFLLQGSGIRKGEKIEGAHIMDVAPTVLHLLGLHVPHGMDGKVLTEAFEPDLLESNPVRFEEVPLEVDPSQHETVKTEEEDVKRMLRGLGYIE